MDRSTYEALALLAVAAWSYSFGRHQGIRRGARLALKGFIGAAHTAGLNNELDALLRAVYVSYTGGTQ